MSPKPSYKTPASWEAHDIQVTKWAKRLWRAVHKEVTYKEEHEDLFKEFKELSDAAQGRDSVYMTPSMLNHVAPIYNHITTQGYQAHIHYEPLKESVCNFCQQKPVTDWKGPPDQFSRSDEAGRSDHNDSEVESAKARKSLPSTDEMELNPKKCNLCERRSHLCHVNPKTVKAAAAACFECYFWRVKCSLSPARARKGKVVAEQNDGQEEEVAASKEPAPKRSRKPGEVLITFFANFN
jgi:hypothetical protein